MLRALFVLALLAPVLALADDPAPSARGDHPEVPRFPGLDVGTIQKHESSGRHAFGRDNIQEGEHWRIVYLPAPDQKIDCDALVKFYDQKVQEASGIKLGEQFTRSGTGLVRYQVPVDGAGRWIEIGMQDCAQFVFEIVDARKTERFAGPPLLEQLKKGAPVPITGIAFEGGKASLLPSSYPVLEDVKAVLGQLAPAQVAVEVYVSSAADAQTNQSLAQRRADAVVTALFTQGADKQQLVATGRGGAKPDGIELVLKK